MRPTDRARVVTLSQRQGVRLVACHRRKACSNYQNVRVPRCDQVNGTRQGGTNNGLALLAAGGFQSHLQDDMWCHGCENRADSTWICGSCARAICEECIKVPSDLMTAAKAPDVAFLCFSSHLKDDMTSGNRSPYRAFFRGGVPAFDGFTAVKSRVELTSNTYFRSVNMAVIHLRFVTIPSGGPIDMLQSFLQPYFVGEKGLRVFDVEFDLGTVAKRQQYISRASRVAK